MTYTPASSVEIENDYLKKKKSLVGMIFIFLLYYLMFFLFFFLFECIIVVLISLQI